MGEDFPTGSSVFHNSLVAGPNAIGGAAPVPMPLACGPLNWGQVGLASCAAAGTAEQSTTTNAAYTWSRDKVHLLSEDNDC